MYFYGFFQTDVLINFFISLRWDEGITWENFVPAKRDVGSTKEGSRLPGMKIFTCNCKICFNEEYITPPGSRQNGTEFHPGLPGSCNHPLKEKNERNNMVVNDTKIYQKMKKKLVEYRKKIYDKMRKKFFIGIIRNYYFKK